MKPEFDVTKVLFPEAKVIGNQLWNSYAEYKEIEDAIEAFGRGEFLIVSDDEGRVNEGDLIIAAEHATPEAGVELAQLAGLKPAAVIVEIIKADGEMARIQYTRATGLSLLLGSKIKFLRKASIIPQLVSEITRIDKRHPFAKYILGSYYLNLPGMFGGNAELACTLLRDAYHSANEYNIENHKFAMTYAKALLKTKRTTLAKEILEKISQHNEDETNQRDKRRSELAVKMLKKASKAA